MRTWDQLDVPCWTPGRSNSWCIPVPDGWEPWILYGTVWSVRVLAPIANANGRAIVVWRDQIAWFHNVVCRSYEQLHSVLIECGPTDKNTRRIANCHNSRLVKSRSYWWVWWLSWWAENVAGRMNCCRLTRWLTCVVILISRSKYTPRSRTDVDAEMWPPPSENTPLSMRCSRHVVMHQRNSLFLGLSCKRLEAVQRTSSIHAITAAFRTEVWPCRQKKYRQSLASPRGGQRWGAAAPNRPWTRFWDSCKSDEKCDHLVGGGGMKDKYAKDWKSRTCMWLLLENVMIILYEE